MASVPTSDFQSFVHFAVAQLDESEAELTPEQCLTIYRSTHPTADELNENVKAVQEALAAMHAGDTGTPLEEFDRQFRQRNGLRSP